MMINDDEDNTISPLATQDGESCDDKVTTSELTSKDVSGSSR